MAAEERDNVMTGPERTCVFCVVPDPRYGHWHPTPPAVGWCQTHQRYADQCQTTTDIQDRLAMLDALQSGDAIVIPRNRDHAEKMLMIAEHWLKKNPK